MVRRNHIDHTEEGDVELIQAACHHVMSKKYGPADFYLKRHRIMCIRRSGFTQENSYLWPVFDPINDRGHFQEIMIIDDTLVVPTGMVEWHAKGRREILRHWTKQWEGKE